MSDDDDKPQTPAWMATFADLMSLLMCFFVLLLSFSEMDVEKFKQIAGSMRSAFGVQDQLRLDAIPKGTSVVATEFSPGKTTESIVETIQQVTDDVSEPSLRVGEGDLERSDVEELLQEKVASLLADTQADADALKKMLEEEVTTGKVDVETDGRTITVRIREQGSFPSGSATLNTDFRPVLERIRDALDEIPGTVSVEGHTDDVPMRGGRYESNWALSSSRALSVVHELLRGDVLDDERMMVVGFADSRPFTFNDTVEGRSSNRRVEIVIRQGIDDGGDTTLQELRSFNSDALDILGIESQP